MNDENSRSLCASYLRKLCEEIPERSVGSEGNRSATRFFEQTVTDFGWNAESTKLDVIDWEEQGAEIRTDESEFEALVSPYSLGCEIEAPLNVITTIEELEGANIGDSCVLLSGEIAKEQIMPKNFVFYNPDEHRRIVSLLEEKLPKVIITATGRNAALAGGVYPFPMFEDGDFDIPSVYMTEEEGQRLAVCIGKDVIVKSRSKRIPASAYNVIAQKGRDRSNRIAITAHIDAKKNSPGAIDNATGVVVLLLVSNLLMDYTGDRIIELVAFNGEDYYGVPGQMDYIARNADRFSEIHLNINIDGAGYKVGRSAMSLFDLPQALEQNVDMLIDRFAGISPGPQWPQGDHSIFLQHGCPAITFSSEWFLENIDTQDITHTPKDNLSIVNCNRVVEIAEAIAWLVTDIGSNG